MADRTQRIIVPIKEVPDFGHFTKLTGEVKYMKIPGFIAYRKVTEVEDADGYVEKRERKQTIQVHDDEVITVRVEGGNYANILHEDQEVVWLVSVAEFTEWALARDADAKAPH